ncbi:MAG: hypothetical protein R3362_01920 [Rhodothermales bacterium]|nr:hypothetical protein [Rhodothermales bacterium]
MPDGISRSVSALSEALLHRGHRVTLLTDEPTDPAVLRRHFPADALPEVHAAPSSTAAPGSASSDVLGLLRPDVAVHNGGCGRPSVPPGLAPGVRLHHLALDDRHLHSLPAHFTNGARRRIAAISTELREALGRELGTPTSTLALLPLCVRLRSYCGAPLVHRERALAHFGTAAEQRPEASIRLMEHVPGALLYVVGRKTTAVREALDGLPPAAHARVRLTGPLPLSWMRELIGAVRGVLVPARHATPTIPPVVLAALASRTPILCTSGISADAVEHDVTGFVDPFDRWAEHARRLLEEEVLWRRLSNGAAIRAGRFSAERIADRYEALAA